MGKKRQTNKKRKGFKACDPFCSDKVRVALYNRPNGPPMGKVIVGKTYLTGLDNKCFSRTGRIKKGYRNVPVDLERDFEIEKRNLSQLNSIVNNKSVKKNENKRNINFEKKKEAKKQTLDNVKRLPQESFAQFVNRVNQLEKLELTKDERESRKKLLKKKKKRAKRIEKKIQEKRQLQKEKQILRKQQKILEKKKLSQLKDPQSEKIQFGETNYRPPDLSFVKKSEKAMLKMKTNKANKTTGNIFDQARKVNLKGVSFAGMIQHRAKEIEYQRAIDNYKLLKQRRRNQRIILQRNLKKKGKMN